MSETDLRYLEGSSAIQERIRAQCGVVPTPEQVAFAQSCMLHGRLFWESAAQAPLETKPLLLYYGAAAFAKALVCVITGRGPNEFKPSHGLTCRADSSERIGDFTITARGVGLFQEFNDVAARLNRLFYLDGASSRTRLYPTAVSERLATFNVRLIDCLARIPSCAEAFRLSTGDDPRLLFLEFSPEAGMIHVAVPVPSNRPSSITDMVETVRRKAPFLSKWRVHTDLNHLDNKILVFANSPPPENELSKLKAGFTYVETSEQHLPFDQFETFPPRATGYARTLSVAYVEPIRDQYVSEFSIMLAALLGLSSLVRYHPHTWTACVHRRPIGGRSVDDALLPVIETFLDAVQSTFPRFVADAILGR